MLRIAIVGLGPKGLFALERLVDHASALDAEAIAVDVFEQSATPGAGAVYDPDQPGYLRMNFPAESIDMWSPTSTVVPPGERPSFVAWRERLAPDADRDRYAPRAQVGAYLADGLVTIRHHAPAAVEITVRRARVTAIRPGGDHWAVSADDEVARLYDEVLLAPGHELTWDSGLAAQWTHAARLVPAVFPVRERLCEQQVPPGATVAVRGFALTFIDAALALTEGRGGTFTAFDDLVALRYEPGKRDVAVIFPFARRGRPMLAKPDPALAAAVPGLAPISELGRERILALADGFDLRRDVVAILAASASAVLRAARGRSGESEPMAAWLAAAAAGAPLAPDRGPAQELARSLAVGTGRAVPDMPWAIGQTWRMLYPAVVARLGGGGLAARDWPAFHRLAAELERVAFGPPPINAAKLLALVDAGRVDLTHVRGGRLRGRRGGTWLAGEHGEHAVDVVVDAVLPGPGAAGAQSEPLHGLLAGGHARVAAGCRGLDVDADGRCRRPDGTPAPGLSAIGRLTEDVVIGNDTLSRTLHPLADRWARSVVARCRCGVLV